MMLSKGTHWCYSFMVLTLIALGCGHDQGTGPQQGLQPTLSSIQANIFTPKCVNQGCHPGQNAPMSLQSGLSFNSLVNQPSTYEGGNLLRVRPNDADNSALMLKVLGDPRTGGVANRMPLGLASLSADEISAIRDWINNGAQNN